MRDAVEILGQIGVYYFSVPLINCLTDLPNRIERAPLRTVAIGRLIEVRFENRFEYQRCRGFDDPISDRGNPERPGPAQASLALQPARLLTRP